MSFGLMEMTSGCHVNETSSLSEPEVHSPNMQGNKGEGVSSTAEVKIRDHTSLIAKVGEFEASPVFSEPASSTPQLDFENLMRLTVSAQVSADLVPALLESYAQNKMMTEFGPMQGMALANVEPDGIPLLIEALNEPKHREVAVIALMHLGPKATSSLPALIKYISTTTGPTREAAVVVVGAIGPNAAEILESLVPAPHPTVSVSRSWVWTEPLMPGKLPSR